MGQSSWLRHSMALLAALVALIAMPFMLIAQTPPGGGTPWWVPIVSPIAVAAVAYVSKFLIDGLKQISPWLDSQSTLVKTVVSTLFTALMGFITGHLTLGFVLPADLSGVTVGTIAGILNALVAAGIYRLEHNNMAARQGLPTKEQQVDGISGPSLAALRHR